MWEGGREKMRAMRDKMQARVGKVQARAMATCHNPPPTPLTLARPLPAAMPIAAAASLSCMGSPSAALKQMLMRAQSGSEASVSSLVALASVRSNHARRPTRKTRWKLT